MTALFLCGAFGWPPIAEQLLGPSLDAARPAILKDAAIVLPEGAVFLVCTERAGARTEGLWLDKCDDAVLDRVRFLAAGLDLAGQLREIDTEAGPVAALCFMSRTAAKDWDAKRWAGTYGPLARLAVQEVLGHHGRFGPADLRHRMPMILARAEAQLIAGQGAPTQVRSATPASEVETEACETRHAGFFLTREYRLRHPGFDGRTSPPLMREVFVATDAAIVLPYDPVQDRVLLVEQFRMGPFGRGDPLPWVLEPVAGRVDPAETPEQTARRECVEEAGVTLRGLEHVSSHYCSPGCSTEFFHCFVGLCDLPGLAKGLGGLETEDEDIRTHVLSFDDAAALVRTGEANNGPLVLLLLWLERERARLRAIA